MNYYIQGNPERAAEIKAAFERNGIDTSANSNYGISNLFYFSCNGEVAVTQNRSTINIIKTHPDYQELELPKPHYNIANFKPFDKVLVRDDDNECWMPSLFGWFDSGLQDGKFVCGTSDWEQCIPFNDDTKHLLGTTDMPDECYINW